MSAKIIVTRKNEFLNKRRDFKIWVDDKEVASVKSGSAEEITVEEGVHNVSVSIKMGFYKTKRSVPLTLNLVKDENKYLLARHGMKYFWLFYIMLLIGLFSKVIMIKSGEQSSTTILIVQLVLVLPSFFYLMYYSFAKNKYLVIENDDKNIFNS